MATDPESLRGRLRSGTEQVWRLYCALEVMTPYKETDPYGRLRFDRRRLTASTVAWHGPAAMLLMDVHTGARRLEVGLREKVSGGLGARRGGSRANTRYALQAVANLAEAVDDTTVLGVLGTVGRWISRADQVMDPRGGLRRVPRAPGEEEMRCPCCAYTTLRWNADTGILVCINPECLDGDGTRPRWAVRFSGDGNRPDVTWESLEAA